MDIVLYCLAIVIAAVITGLLGYFMVPFLHKIKFGQTIREVGPSWHKNKQGTPTMGGIMFIIGSSVAAVICIAFLWLNGGAETQLMFVKVVAGALMAVGFGIVGFLDDYISIKKHRNLGLTEIQKLILQFIIVGAYLLSVALAGGTTETVIPFLGSVDLGFFYYILAAVFIVGMVNAVNFTDGIDGLNTSVTLVVALVFSVIAMLLNRVGLSLYAAAIVGAMIGFLFWNANPRFSLLSYRLHTLKFRTANAFSKWRRSTTTLKCAAGTRIRFASCSAALHFLPVSSAYFWRCSAAKRLKMG